MNLRFLPYSIMAVFPVLVACSRVPKGVIPPEEMAQLMADTYMGEGVVDMNNNLFPTDSSRMVLKQSIYHAHGVTREMVDTSFAWYGMHIEDYLEVLERTEEILKDRQHSLAASSSRQLSISGDSVNVWAGAERITVARGYPRRFVTFAITPDTTWHKGDSYTLRYKLINGQRQINSRVCVDYQEGVTKVYDGRGRSQGVTSLTFKINPDMTPTRLYGYIDIDARPNEHFNIDSIALIRTRESTQAGFYSPSGTEVHWGDARIPVDTVPAAKASSSPDSSTPGAASVPKEAPLTTDIPPATIGPQTVRRSR